METKFSPGPWRIATRAERQKCGIELGGYDCGAVMSEKKTHLATIRNWNADVDSANAALICAAPELYAALLETVAMLELDGHFGGAVSSAKLALAKARGEIRA